MLAGASLSVGGAQHTKPHHKLDQSWSNARRSHVSIQMTWHEFLLTGSTQAKLRDQDYIQLDKEIDAEYLTERFPHIVPLSGMNPSIRLFADLYVGLVFSIQLECCLSV